MGSSVSSPIAIIFMHFIEQQIKEELPGKILMWSRYIDDVFVIYKDMSSLELLNKCNDILYILTYPSL